MSGPRASAVVSLCSMVLLFAGCDRSPPSPWKEMKLPMTNAEILPGASESRLRLVFRGLDETDGYYREYRRALERAGYTYEADGKNHDPAARTLSTIFVKGTERLRLTITGGGSTSIELKKILD